MRRKRTSRWIWKGDKSIQAHGYPCKAAGPRARKLIAAHDYEVMMVWGETWVVVQCPTCKEYTISNTLEFDILHLKPPNRELVSRDDAGLKLYQQMQELKQHQPTISEEDAAEVSRIFNLSPEIKE